MGMYTEIYVNVDLKADTSQDVIDTLKCMASEIFAYNNCDDDYFNEQPIHYDSERFNELMRDKPHRWPWLFRNGSYYTHYTQVANLTYDFTAKQWSFIGKGDIKNYQGEIQQFFEWIAPYSETEFLGYSRYEESVIPDLHYKQDYMNQPSL